MRGNPSRLGDAIRNNRIPVVMIGIGALWLAFAMNRPQLPRDDTGSGASAASARIRSPRCCRR